MPEDYKEKGEVRRECPTCEGSKAFMGEDCSMCDGRGYLVIVPASADSDRPDPIPYDHENQLSLL